MPLQQLAFELKSQNQRVNGFEISGDEQSYVFMKDQLLDDGAVDDLIQAAYRQIFNEQQLLSSNRLVGLESKLKIGQITVKDFIRGLLLSPVFRERNYDVNNNYRFARICIERVLGRQTYGDREILSWSILLATKGLHGFVDALLDSDEYNQNFGENTVPYQRRRILPQRAEGDVTFAHTPRYDETHLAQLKSLGYDFDRKHVPGRDRWSSGMGPTRWQWQQQPYPLIARRIAAGVTILGASTLAIVVLAVVFSWFGFIHI